jgi:hypothetical protein
VLYFGCGIFHGKQHGENMTNAEAIDMAQTMMTTEIERLLRAANIAARGGSQDEATDLCIEIVRQTEARSKLRKLALSLPLKTMRG